MNYAWLLILFLFPLGAYSYGGREVSIDWEMTAGAISYDVELTDITQSEKPVTSVFKTKEAKWTGKIPPGNYKMRMRSRDKRDVPGDWSPAEQFEVMLESPRFVKSKPLIKIESKELEEDSIEIKWSKVPLATFYLFVLRDANGKTLDTKKVTEEKIELKIKVAQRYSIEVTAISEERKTQSKESDKSDVEVWGPTLANPQFNVPENEFVRQINWTPSPYRENYQVQINRFDEKQKKWITAQNISNLNSEGVGLPLEWPGGRYKVQIKAEARLRYPSKAIAMRFNVIDGDRSPAAETTATVRKSIDRTEGYFGIASYLITMINYSGSNQDFGGADAKVTALGGTGRLGLGYLDNQKNWGFLGIIDYSGFIIDNRNNTFASLEANAVYRKSYLDRGELRQHLGLFYKELPELVGNGFGDFVGTKTIATAGPHYALEYWHALTPKLGFQFNLHAYLNALKVKTPNNQPIGNDISYQVGILGSYRLKKNITGLAGYALKNDIASYKSSNNEQLNRASVLGNYLNFFLEWTL